VYDLTILAQVLPSSRGNSQVALAFVVALEECQGITTSDDASALIVEEGGRIPFEKRDGVCMWCWKTF
jgi:hypothetical protein